MITLKVDPTIQVKLNDEITDMETVLSEIGPTLRILEELLNQHEASISTPSIDSYRRNIKAMIPEAIRITHLISINSQRLAAAGSQVAKQLAAIESQAKTALVSKSNQLAPTSEPVLSASNNQSQHVEAQNFRLFQRQS